MYFFYVDESGNRDPAVHGGEHIYVLAAIGLWEGAWKKFDREITLLKLEMLDDVRRRHGLKLDLADCEVKSGLIRITKDRETKSPFLHALSEADRERLVKCYFEQIERRHMMLFAVVVDKRHLHDHVTHETMHKKAYELLLERIEFYMAGYHPKHNALIVMDNTSSALNRAVSLKHAWFQREGNQRQSFRHIVEYPFFVESYLSNGVQLTDLIAYNIYRAFKTQDFKYPYFSMLLSWFYRRQDSDRLEGLKVFPEESPCAAWARTEWDTLKTNNPTVSGGVGNEVRLGYPYRAGQRHPTPKQ